ncbi:tetratricopeptide repeat protein, partial [Phenylobacterium sp.]|uniref:tetratricopeptide repeat protein n=1 Tax=Phenylobacterium sp. TaxID=1871053 RepID=UPI00286B32AB
MAQITSPPKPPAPALQALLRKALDAVRAGRRDEAAATALEALEIDETSSPAWHILGVCRERAGDFTGALQAYEAALSFAPDEPELASDLARLALKMGMAQVAEGLLRSYLARRPDSVDALNNLGVAQRDQMKFGLAVETLRGAIQANPDSAMLWNTLASVLTLQGQTEQALVFYDEALRLEPGFAGALYNRAMARLAAGATEGVIADFDAAIAAVPIQEAGGMRVARAWALLALGDLTGGWAAYAARHDIAYEDAVHF